MSDPLGGVGRSCHFTITNLMIAHYRLADIRCSGRSRLPVLQGANLPATPGVAARQASWPSACMMQYRLAGCRLTASCEHAEGSSCRSTDRCPPKRAFWNSSMSAKAFIRLTQSRHRSISNANGMTHSARDLTMPCRRGWSMRMAWCCGYRSAGIGRGQ